MKSERTPEVVLLVVETATGDAAEERALRQVVNGTLGLDARGRYWHVERLFPPVGAEPSDLDRYFRVSGSIDAPPHLFEQVAFELAYRLSDAGRLRVEPDLPSSSFAPPPAEDFLEAAAGPEHHLPASDSHTWALEAVHCPEAWELPPPEGGASRGEGVIIAHPDTGYTNHRAIDIAAFDLRLDWDILSNDDDASDPLETRGGFPLVNPGHGTSTASVLAGRILESREGAAPRATIVPLRTIKSVVQVFDSDVARAVDYARRIGAHVVSMSLGGTGFRGLRDAVDYAVADGLIVLAAAGNQVRFVVAPASYPNCIAVAATNAEDKPWVGSSQGREVDLSAPGESVWVAKYHFEPSGPRPDIERHHGTSFAVTHAAGAAALWLAHHGRDALIERYGKPLLQAVFLHLVSTAGHRRPQGWNTERFGVGIINAAALLAAPLPDLADVEGAHPERVLEAITPPTAERAGERVAALFPDLTTEEVNRRLSVLFGASDEVLAAKLDRYEPELVRIFSERPDAWEAFAAAPADGALLESPSGHPGAALARLGSPTLVRDLRPNL